jgi:hypothetical protein
MGYSKGAAQPPPAVYRDEPDYAETASMASAVLLDDVDFPDEELPAYEDAPSQSAVVPRPAISSNAPGSYYQSRSVLPQHFSHKHC